MKFSVITIAYNSEATIARTIEAVLAQTCSDLEYRIVDGASRDRTVEIAESYREAFREKGIDYHIVSEPDNGIYHAMNKGIRLAAGDIIGIINSGDWYEPDALESVSKAYEEQEFDLLYADIRMHKSDGRCFIKKARQRRFETSRDWNHPTTFVKAQVYKENPFRELGIHDDYGFFLQVKKQGKKIVTIDKVLANFEMGGASNRKSLKAAGRRIMDRYRYCYRINGYSRWYFAECVLIEAAKMVLG